MKCNQSRIWTHVAVSNSCDDSNYTIFDYYKVYEIKWSICTPKSHKTSLLSFSRADAGLYIYHLFVWSNLNFLRISQWITLPTQSCLVLYSFCTNLLYSLIMWLIVSSLSPHNLHLLFCFVLFILALKWLVLMALFYAAFRKDSVSFLRFPLLCHIKVF